jgi:hypothetical protein
MKGFQLIATGGALPGRTVTNEELSRTVDTSDAWITSRTGIRTRHWCTADESAATLAIAAAKQALQRSGLAPADIACCVCATLSAPDATPSVACQVQAALGLPENRPALDVNAACSGFLYGTAVARGLLATLGGQYALVIGCEALSRLMDPADRSTCVLFGDGAGAAIFRLADTPFALTLGARGSDVLNDYSRMQLQHTKISLSFSALLFGPFYFFYRKAWKPAFAFLAAELLLFVPTLLQMMQITGSSLSLGLSDSTYVVLGRVVSLASFALMLVRGMFAKWFYRKSAAEHIRRIRAEFPDDAQRSVVLSAQGGVSWGAVLGSLLLLMVFGACCSMLLGPNLDVLLNALS